MCKNKLKILESKKIKLSVEEASNFTKFIKLSLFTITYVNTYPLSPIIAMILEGKMPFLRIEN